MFLLVLDLFLHLDVHLAQLSQHLGLWTYLILFLIVFAETGLVITPFLPGDSLLFAAGALSALPDSGLHLGLLFGALAVAGILGDSVNYAMGLRIGPKVFQSQTSLLLNKRHLVRAQEFYERHGPLAIVLARFVPIVRTFAPFVAGIGRMEYKRFLFFNVAGGLTWVGLFLFGGFWFGNLPAIRSRFHFVIVGIVLVSVLPIVWQAVRHRLQRAKIPSAP